MWLVYLPVSLLALIIAVKLFGFYERDVCTTLLCWIEALAETRTRKRMQIREIARGGFFPVHKTRLH
jgi:hypothetical protein